MGFFQNLLGVSPDDSVNKVDAAVAPYNYQQYAQPFDYFGLSSINRAQAMQVPAVARARNIICATIGSLPLEVRRESNNSKVPTPPFIRQPDPRMTGQSVYTFLAAHDRFISIYCLSFILNAHSAAFKALVSSKAFVCFVPIKPFT